MSEAFWIAIIVGVGSPVLLHLLASWAKRREREEDRAERKAILEAAKDTAIGLATLGVKVDGVLADRDKKNVQEGERKGEKNEAGKAAALAEGQRQGAETARASVAASNNTPAPAPPAIRDPAWEDAEVPTKDRRVAEATERSAVAQERVATAAEEKK